MKKWQAYPDIMMRTRAEMTVVGDVPHRDYLVTEDTVEYVAHIFDKNGIFTKPYTESRGFGVHTVGLRIGEKPDHVVAFWGDTVRVFMKDHRTVVMRLSEVRPKPEMTWHTVSPDEQRAQDALAYEERQARLRATCSCDKPQKDDYTLSIDSGAIEIHHRACGKMPWFMFDDFTEAVSMSPQQIEIDDASGCTSGCELSCDCGPDISLRTLGGKW